MATQSNQTRHEREIVITRVVDAPREVVFKAWTDQAQVAQWWGPHGFTNPTCEIDPRVGGALFIVMRGPDGAEFPMRGAYRVFDPPSRIVFTSTVPGSDGNPVIEGLTTVTFAAQANKTTVTVAASATAYGDFGAMAIGGMEEGWTQSLEKFDYSLVAERAIITTRAFDAPRELVYKAWVQPEHVAQWWGPNGFTNTVHEMEVRPGGVWRLTMHGPDGTDFPNKIVFTEVVPNERLAYDHGDDNSGMQFHVTVSFRSFGEQTWLTMQAVFDSAATRKKVAEEYGAVEGAEQTLARLADHLATM